MSQLKEFSSHLLSECQSLEPGSAEVCADQVSETKVVFENTDFSVASSSQATVLGLRTIINGRQGFITTNNLDKNELSAKAKEAQLVAKLSPQNDAFGIAPKGESGQYTAVDEKLQQAGPKEILAWTDLLVSETKKDPRVALDRAEVSLSSSSRVIQNSNGIDQQISLTTCGWYVMGMAKDGNEVTSFDYDGNTTGSIDSIEDQIKKTAEEFRESVLGSLSAKGGKSYNGPVLLHPAAVASLMAQVVASNVNARAQQDGMSQWKGRLGETVASSLLTISTNPQNKDQIATWAPFDREGVLTSNQSIVENGVLKLTAHNTFTANRAKTQSNGFATGGSRSTPSIGVSAMKVHGGDKTLNDLTSALNSGLVLKRFSGNSDPVSGRFSGVAKNSWWIEKGQKTHALKEIMVSGNMFDLLKSVQMIGKDLFSQHGSFEAPYLLVDGLSVTAG